MSIVYVSGELLHNNLDLRKWPYMPSCENFDVPLSFSERATCLDCVYSCDLCSFARPCLHFCSSKDFGYRLCHRSHLACFLKAEAYDLESLNGNLSEVISSDGLEVIVFLRDLHWRRLRSGPWIAYGHVLGSARTSMFACLVCVINHNESIYSRISERPLGICYSL